MSNIGAFIKKNALMLGIGAVGIAGAIYFLTRKKKRSGLSGVSRRTRPSGVSRRRVGVRSKHLKPIKLS